MTKVATLLFWEVFIIFTDSRTMTGYAYPQVYTDGYTKDIEMRKILTNFIMMFSSTIEYERYKDYDVLSHELGHVLVNLYQSFIPKNFLSHQYDGMNISQKQCQAIRDNRYLYAL